MKSAKNLILILVYCGIALLPLLLVVGRNLEYEYALAVSWLTLLLLPLCGLILPLRCLPESPPESIPAAFFWIFFVSPAFLLMPGMTLFLSHMCPCSPQGFLFWMALLVYPALILGHGIFFGIIRARSIPLQRRWISGGLILGYTLAIGYGLAQLWFHPQKRLDHLMLGFLHGPIYDFWIPVDLGIFLERVSTLFFSVTILILFWLQKKWGLILSLCASLATAVSLKVLSQSYPSTLNSEKALHQFLYKTLQGRGLSLHYRPKKSEHLKTAPSDSKNKEIEAEYEKKIATLFTDAQFHVDELKSILAGGKETFQELPSVKIFVYPTEDEKKLLFGGGSTDVTDVVTPSVHLMVESFPHPTLRHELVHALASGFGFYGLGFHPNIAFTEGLAIALAPVPGDLSLDEGAASLLDSGRISRVENLFSPFFWQESGSRAYTTAGSLIKYILETYGISAVKDLYRGESFSKALGKDQTIIVQEWTQKIMSSYDKKTVEIFTEALYRQGGVFQDLCPHTKKDYEKGKSEGLFLRLRQPVAFQNDRDYLPWLLSLDPVSLSVQNRLWRQEILRLTKERFPKTQRLETWAETLRFARVFPPVTLEDVELAIQESDLLRFLGRKDESIKILTELQKFSELKYLGEGLTRFLLVRLLVEQIDGENAVSWRHYFSRFKSDIPDTRPTLEGPWIHLYLKLRSTNPKITWPPHDLELLAHGHRPPPRELPDSFGREYYGMIGSRLMDLRNFTAAAAAYRRASLHARSLHREHLDEMVRRALYHAQTNLTPASHP